MWAAARIVTPKPRSRTPNCKQHIELFLLKRSIKLGHIDSLMRGVKNKSSEAQSASRNMGLQLAMSGMPDAEKASNRLTLGMKYVESCGHG